MILDAAAFFGHVNNPNTIKPLFFLFLYLVNHDAFAYSCYVAPIIKRLQKHFVHTVTMVCEIQ